MSEQPKRVFTIRHVYQIQATDLADVLNKIRWGSVSDSDRNDLFFKVELQQSVINTPYVQEEEKEGEK